MAFDQTDFLAISVNIETSASLAFYYARPWRRRRGKRLRLRLHNWRWGRWFRLWLLFNYRRWNHFWFRALARATDVGRNNALDNWSWRRARNDRSRGRARNDRSRSRARNDRSRS